MDAINMIFENYGSERLARVFKTYWMLLLIIKQTILSLFMVEPVNTDPLPANLSPTVKEVTACQQETEWRDLDFLRFMILVSHLQSENETEDAKTLANPISSY